MINIYYYFYSYNTCFFQILVGTPQSHQNHTSSRATADSQQQSQVSAAEIMSAAGLAAMAAAELGIYLLFGNFFYPEL